MKQFSKTHKTNIKKSITSFYTDNNQLENKIDKISFARARKENLTNNLKAIRKSFIRKAISNCESY